jgi:hypothetical protein
MFFVSICNQKPHFFLFWGVWGVCEIFFAGLRVRGAGACFDAAAGAKHAAPRAAAGGGYTPSSPGRGLPPLYERGIFFNPQFF